MLPTSKQEAGFIRQMRFSRMVKDHGVGRCHFVQNLS